MKNNKKEKVAVLKRAVDRNKLKDKGNNFDKAIQFLEKNGIEAKSCYSKEK